MPGNDLIFYGTTGLSGTSDGNPSTPDPADWLGRFRAPETLHELQSTLTSTQDARGRHFIVDTARIGDGAQAHQLKWIAMLTGPTALAAARVMSFDTATGIFKLDRSLEGAGVAVAGDDYAIFPVNNVWPDVSAAQARSGEERFRCVVLRNQHGASITDVRVYLRVLDAGGRYLSRFNQKTGGAGSFLQRADDVTDLFDALGLRDPAGGPDGFVNTGGWLNPFGYAVADTSVTTLSNNTNIAIWLRRLIPAGLRFRRSIAIQLIVESTTAGSDPDPLAGSAVLAYDIDGETITASIDVDRYVGIGGGARLTGAVLGDGLAIADRPALWSIRPGDLGSIFTDDDPAASYDVTDDDGQVGSTFIAPTSLAVEGEISHPRLIVGAGGEVGDPFPFTPQLQSIDLDGSTEALRSAQAILNFSNTWTIGGWFRRTDAGTLLQVLFDTRNTGGSSANLILWERPVGTSARWRIRMWDSAASQFKSFTTDINVLVQDTWVHLVATFDGAVGGDPLLMYADGVDVTTASPSLDSTGTMTDTARRFHVGARTGDVQFFQGQVLSFAAHDVPLSPAEILATYNAGSGSTFDLNADHAIYVSRLRLQHWFRAGHEASPGIGRDYARAATPPLIDLIDEAANITDADRVSEVP